MDTTLTEVSRITFPPETKKVEKERSIQSNPGFARLLLSGMALILWMMVGGVLSWLLKDFGRALEPEVAIVPPSVILSLYVVSACVIGRFSWNSFQRTKLQ